MSTAIDADLLVVGAGVAGLSLAWHLLDRGLDPKGLLLIDPRESYEHDRTFCAWNVVAHPFEDLVDHRWSRWRVRAGGAWIERGAPGLSYQQLPASTFYDRVLARLDAAGVELRRGVRARAIRELAHAVEVETDAGTLHSRAVFDSRPIPSGAGPRSDEVVLLQHFEGWHVRTEAAVFEPGVATLMDFAVSQDEGIHFFYVLPYGPDEALVEATFFSPAVLAENRYAEHLERYMSSRFGAPRWTLLRRERGVIPMSTEAMPLRAGPRVYRIGLPGGMAKPSTGYAFQAIQRFSGELASRLMAEPLPDPPEPRTWRARALDRIFLSYLNRYPRLAPSTFATLFEKLDPGLLARFLSDRASAAECVLVMRALALTPVTLEPFRSTRLWARR